METVTCTINVPKNSMGVVISKIIDGSIHYSESCKQYLEHSTVQTKEDLEEAIEEMTKAISLLQEAAGLLHGFHRHLVEEGEKEPQEEENKESGCCGGCETCNCHGNEE